MNEETILTSIRRFQNNQMSVSEIDIFRSKYPKCYEALNDKTGMYRDDLMTILVSLADKVRSGEMDATEAEFELSRKFAHELLFKGNNALHEPTNEQYERAMKRIRRTMKNSET